MEFVKRNYRRIVRRLTRGFYTEMESRFQSEWESYIANPFARYDLQTFHIIKIILNSNSNSIDVGAHVGEVLGKMIEASPSGKHFAFEPLPHLYNGLKQKFSTNAEVYPFALSNTTGTTSFNHVVSNPYYSGLLERQYPSEETINVINVEVRRLDEVVPISLPIHLIKIDVEGGEFGVLQGAEKILRKWKPIIIYEQGLGSAEFYGTTPDAFFDYMSSFGYKISLMDYFIANLEPFTKEEYCIQFQKRYNYYFIAY